MHESTAPGAWQEAHVRAGMRAARRSVPVQRLPAAPLLHALTGSTGLKSREEEKNQSLNPGVVGHHTGERGAEPRRSARRFEGSSAQMKLETRKARTPKPVGKVSRGTPDGAQKGLAACGAAEVEVAQEG